MTSSKNGLVTVPWPDSLVTELPKPLSLTTLTGSRRENTWVGKIPAGSRSNRDSWRDTGEDKDSPWESRRDLWRDFFS